MRTFRTRLWSLRVARCGDAALAELYVGTGGIAFGLAVRVLRDRALRRGCRPGRLLRDLAKRRTLSSGACVARTGMSTLLHRRAVDLVRRQQRRPGPRSTRASRRGRKRGIGRADLTGDRSDMPGGHDWLHETRVDRATGMPVEHLLGVVDWQDRPCLVPREKNACEPLVVGRVICGR
jgi:hypothetical protein